MDLKGPIKSVIISGNLKNTKLTYKLCPVTEFADGVWNIAIKCVSYVCLNENFKENCKISCNLSKAQKWNNFSYRVEVTCCLPNKFQIFEKKHLKFTKNYY